MKIPAPEVGLVIRYSYLWADDHDAGREEGRKDRPCAIIAAILDDEGDGVRVLVLPITHSPPTHNADAVAIPPQLNARIGLDSEPCWVAVHEFNVFYWPGPDLRPVPTDPDGSVAYGFVPRGFFDSIKAAFLSRRGDGRQRAVPRT